MKFALVQFTPVPRDVPENIKKIKRLLEPVSKVDVILLPEMALTGYIFENKQQIQQILDAYGPMMVGFCLELAAHYNCHVQIGMPRYFEGRYYNSVLFSDPDGKMFYYDKHFLYETDYSWAEEGPSFKYRDSSLGRIGFAICMDVNNYKFEAPFEAFECSNFHLENKATILLMSMAWLTPGTPITSKTISEAIHYWALRLTPLIQQSTQDIIVAIANRTGMEQSTRFVGCSCMFLIRKGTITLLGHLGIDDQSVLEIDTTKFT